MASAPIVSNRPLAMLVVAGVIYFLIQTATPEGAIPEENVHPGFNKQFREPDVSEFVGRFEREDREVYENRERILEALDLRPGMSVADVGAGTGFYSLMLAQAVGPSGRVYAQDISQAFLESVRKRAAEAGLKNIETVLGADRDARLPKDSVDLVFICDTYHHFEYPRNMLASIRRALREGGVLVIVDFDRVEGQSREWILDHVRIGRRGVISEVARAGFDLVDSPPADYLKENYILRFRKRAANR